MAITEEFLGLGYLSTNYWIKQRLQTQNNGEILQHGYSEYSTNVITNDYQTTIKLIY